jgi:pyridoxamine 5'-phosphate oxidase
MWWEHVATQIRVKGVCAAISEQEADAHWASRLRDAQIATATFRQSRPLANLELLSEEYSRAVAAYEGKTIPRPDTWGGFRLRAEHIEFLEFKENRMHVRTAYALVGLRWQKSFLQP